MSEREHRVIIPGPPGTGKTRRLLSYLDDELNVFKTKPDRIAFIAYSRAAVRTIRNRITNPDVIVKTMHTLGSEAQGLDPKANLLQGKDVEESAKSAADVGLGSYIGFTLGGPVGATIGSFVSKSIIKRVICNELMRQGIMDKKQVILDYKFTKDYLSEQHVNGYHMWAVWVVKQMRKGKYVKFWSHIAKHRANEIEYIYKYRNKPDYLGKIYRKILEPTCWFLGLFNKKTNWQVLYKERKI